MSVLRRSSSSASLLASCSVQPAASEAGDLITFFAGKDNRVVSMSYKDREVTLKLQKDEYVSGKFYLPESSLPVPVVVYLHGYGSSCSRQRQLAMALSALGIAFVCFDFPPSDRAETLATRIDVAQLTLNELYDLPEIDVNHIGLCGSSMGAYVAAILMGRLQSAKAVVLRAPVMYLDDWQTLPLRQLPPAPPLSALQSSNAEPLRNMESFAGDLLIVISELDTVARPESADLCLAYARNAASAAKIVIQGAGHTLLEAVHKKQFVHHASSWFARSLLPCEESGLPPTRG